MLKFDDKITTTVARSCYQRLPIQVEGRDNVLMGQTSCGSSYIRRDGIERLSLIKVLQHTEALRAEAAAAWTTESIRSSNIVNMTAGWKPEQKHSNV